MLKKIYINGKKIPVPVPLQDLEQALQWVEQTFNRGDSAVTRILLDRKEVRPDDQIRRSSSGFTEYPLNVDSFLELQIDSPLDLTIQLLDTLRNLASVLEASIKQVAVECWKSEPQKTPDSLIDFIEDISLTLDLLMHLEELASSWPEEFSALRQMRVPIKRIVQSLQLAQSQSDWKACAKILLNSFEGYISDVIAESHRGQSFLFTTKAQVASRQPNF